MDGRVRRLLSYKDFWELRRYSFLSIREALIIFYTHALSFRVYVGNGQSLLCSNLSPQSDLRIQGHFFRVDLHIFPVHGLDIILGMSWLHSLHRVTSDYDVGTLEFEQGGRPVCLRVTPCAPRAVSAATCAAMLRYDGAKLFKIVQLDTDIQAAPAAVDIPSEVPSWVREVLLKFESVFCVPSGMPPVCAFDHRIHLLPTMKPVNVHPY